MKNKRTYDNEFIQESIKLVQKGNKSLGRVADSLGIPSVPLGNG
jgi:hypothetical protein